MRRIKYLGSLLLIFFLVLTGCNTNDAVEEGLVISSISFGLGGEVDETLVSYTFNLWNKSNQEVNVKTVQPILTDELNKRVKKDGLINKVNKKINENSSEEISGSFYLDTQGLDKEEILKLNIKLDKFRITTEQDVGRKLNP